MKPFHVLDMPGEIGDEHGGLLVGRHQGGADIAGKQDLRLGIIDVEIARGMQVMRRHEAQAHILRQRYLHAFVGNGGEGGVAVEMSGETRPQPREIDLEVRPAHPAPQRQRRADVGILMRQEQRLDVVDRNLAGQRRQHARKHLHAAGIEQDRRIAGPDQILVGVDDVVGLVRVLAEGLPTMIAVAEQGDALHGSLSLWPA